MTYALDANVRAFAMAAAGAINRVRQVAGISVIDFGAVGDGVTDDTAAINAAIDHAEAAGLTVLIPKGTYRYNGYRSGVRRIEVSIEGHSMLDTFLVPSQEAVDAGNYMFLGERFTDVSGLALAASIKPNQQQIVLTSVADLAKGMVLQISSSRLWYNGHRDAYYCGEIHRIMGVNPATNTVEIEDFTRDAYGVADALTIRAWTPSKVSIKNLGFDAPYPSSLVTSAGVAIQQTADAVLENLWFKGFRNASIVDNLSVKTQMKNVHFFQDSDFDTSIANCYGISLAGTLGTVVDGLYSKGLRRAFDASAIAGTALAAISRDWTVRNFDVVGGGAWFPVTAATSYGIGMHGPSDGGVIENGTIADCQNGVTARGRNTAVRRVKFQGKMLDCVSLHENGAGLILENCEYESGNHANKLPLADAEPGSGCATFLKLGLSQNTALTGPIYDLPIIVRNNSAKGLTKSLIQFAQNTATIKGLSVTENRVEAAPGASGTFTMFDAGFANTSLTDALFDNNDAIALNGSISHWSPNLILAVREGNTVRFRSNRAHYARIPNNAVARIPRVAPAGQRIIVQAEADSAGVGNFVLRPNNGLLVNLGGTSVEWGATNNPTGLTGTTAPAGTMTFGLTAEGDLYIENRMGSTYTIRLAIQ